jgi:hypothetical protein
MYWERHRPRRGGLWSENDYHHGVGYELRPDYPSAICEGASVE